ncbi:MAG: hypothetical protein CSB33_05265 [Desulfobacterales bacterium]|nr:MAG: hypothetical protein CSB33_05265 [Desulfobacterales bacterium]
MLSAPASASPRTPFFLTSAFFLLLLTNLSCLASDAQPIRLQGETMGTTYHITVLPSTTSPDAATLHRVVEARLKKINTGLSVFDPQSEISRFNKLTDTSACTPLSADLAEVMRVGKQVHVLSGGAWDATVGPLVRLWGFGPGHKPGPPAVPPDADIARARERTGFHLLEIRSDGVNPPCLKKGRADLALNLGSVAKGFGVDAVAAALAEKGVVDCMVEIGGEVMAKGRRPGGKSWLIGINVPRPDASPTEVFRAVRLSDAAMATSGDYRNFFRVGGKRMSHIIDPRTGRPTEHGVVAASVIAPNCTLADALATALMVMDPEKGKAAVESLPGVECLILSRTDGKQRKETASAGFAAYVERLPRQAASARHSKKY